MIRPVRFFVWIVAAILWGSLQAGAQDIHWLSDYSTALKQAKSDNKSILLDFTGSDWCPWCIRMDKEVLQTKEFQDYAAKYLVLMLVDFPRNNQLSQKIQDQNAELQHTYGTEGFPTFIVIDQNGKVLGKQIGYLQGGPKAFIAKLESMK